MAFAYCMFVHVVLVSGSSAVASLCTQGGRFNCLQCAARYGRTELFHHLVQRYDCDPKAKDRNTTVSHSSTRLHRQRCDLLVSSGHCHSLLLRMCSMSYMCNLL